MNIRCAEDLVKSCGVSCEMRVLHCRDMLRPAGRCVAAPPKGGEGVGGGRGHLCVPASPARPSVRPCLPACSRACVPACRPVYACVRLPAFVWRVCPSVRYVRPSVHPCLSACSRSCVPVCAHACLRACMRARPCSCLRVFVVRRICAFLRACR